MGVRSSISQQGIPASRFGALYYNPTDLIDGAGDVRPGVGVIESGEHFSISLLSAYICGFRESKGLDVLIPGDDSNPPQQKGSGCREGGREPEAADRTTRGEVAIIVNTGEGIRNAFNPSAEENTGRVIYYNEDVRESGQLINARNIPIYGPQKYNGDSVTFDLWMLELDNEENAEVSELLSSLSSMGQTAYPPSAPALKVLNTLGSAFLSGNHDDLQARINMRFDTLPPRDSQVFRLPLREGYYAFVREENRDLNPEWTTFQVNEQLGELCEVKAGQRCDASDQSTYRGQTWFLIRIAKESAVSALKFETQETIAAFTNRMATFKAQEYKKTSALLQALDTNLDALVCKSTEVKDKAGSIDQVKTQAKRSELELDCDGTESQ